MYGLLTTSSTRDVTQEVVTDELLESFFKHWKESWVLMTQRHKDARIDTYRHQCFKKFKAVHYILVTQQLMCANIEKKNTEFNVINQFKFRNKMGNYSLLVK